jgi:hypothetical protein
MENIQSVLVVLGGLLIRLAIPFAITAVAVTILRAEDKRWEQEARQIPLPMAKPEKPYCWVINNCAPEKMKSCEALYSPEPCWQVKRQNNGYLSEACLACKVFQHAPAPTPAHAPVAVHHS